MNSNTADSINLPRSTEYNKLIQELKDCIVSSTTTAAQRLYEQGKRDGLTNEIIRKDIEVTLDGIVKERRLREILPLELKQISKIRKPALRHSGAANSELKKQDIKTEEYRTEDLIKYDREQLIKIIKWYEKKSWKYELNPIRFTYDGTKWDFGRDMFKLHHINGRWDWDTSYRIEKIPIVMNKNKVRFDIDGFKKQITSK